MCGIAGFCEDTSGPAALTMLRRMTDVLAHRGPNGQGHVLLGDSTNDLREGPPPAGSRVQVALGNRRLAILDLRPEGHMPMSDGQGNWLTYNGEVYNYIELREELTKLGHTFRTDTDTEVILAAYREWGPGCLARFNGMFAFALWDAGRRLLFCARDRFGVKPFYFHLHQAPGLLVFASEIKALLEHPRVPRRPNDAVIHDYLALGLADHTDETFFEGIRRLPAGHTLTWKDGQVTLDRWHRLDPTPRLDHAPGEERDAIHQLRLLFEDAVRLRLRSDVPIGTCLSGGLDSSTIVVVANRQMRRGGWPKEVVGERQRTFTACFDDPRLDERRYADEVVQATGADNRRTFPDAASLWADLPRMVWHFDEPFQSTSQFTQWRVMALAREHGVTVTLDGQGGDELLAGYPGYYGAWIATLVRRGHLRRALREARDIHARHGEGRDAGSLALRSAYALLPNAVRRGGRRLLGAREGTPEGRIHEVLQPSFVNAHEGRRRAWLRRQADLLGDLNAKLLDDLCVTSLPALLRYEDRSSMAFSIEARTPFLDYRVVELCASMPPSLKVREGWTKWALREAMADELPPGVRLRTDKKGFASPEVAWLRELAPRIRELFADRPRSTAYLDPARVLARLDRLLDGHGDRAAATDVFRMVCLELWMRAFFRQEGPA